MKRYLPAFTMALLISWLATSLAYAGGQLEEPLSNSVKALMQSSISDKAPSLIFSSDVQAQNWLTDMSYRLKKRMPNDEYRAEFLRSVQYEAARAGLDPALVMGLIQVESDFKKYVVSSVGARGYMQVMPFWVKSIGATEHNLFHLRLNLRYGCTILRHYLDLESGDLYRALGRYNGSLGQAQYPNLVIVAWHKNWQYVSKAL